MKGGYKHICGNPNCKRVFYGRKNKLYCSKRCRNNMKVSSPTKRANHNKYMREHRLKQKVVRYCKKCGAKIPKNRKIYCSHQCMIKGDRREGLKAKIEEDCVLQKYVPIYCEECGSRVVLMSDGVYCCEKCGLVY